MFRGSGRRRELPVAPRINVTSSLPAAGGRIEEDLLAAGLDSELVARLAGWCLRTPPLRERTDDLMPLAEMLAVESLGLDPGPLRL